MQHEERLRISEACFLFIDKFMLAPLLYIIFELLQRLFYDCNISEMGNYHKLARINLQSGISSVIVSSGLLNRLLNIG